MFSNSKQLFNGGDSIRDGWSDDNFSARVALCVCAHGRPVFINSLLVGLALSFGQVKAENIKVKGGSAGLTTPSFESVKLSPEKQLYRIGNSVEFLTSISALGEPVAKQSPQPKRNDSPRKSDEGRVSVKEKHELTEDARHNFYQFLLTQLVAFLIMFPLGIYFSTHISPAILERRQRWMRYHQIKAKRWHRKHPGESYPMPRRTFCQWIWF